MDAPAGPDRSFLDANILFTAAYSHRSIVRRLWSFDPTEVILITSGYAIGEGKQNLSPSAWEDLYAILHSVEVVSTPHSDAWILHPGIILPAKDEPVLQAAIAANASHLITGDRRHFGAYFGQRIGSVLILKPRCIALT
jgi:predicted nucleic acid-binding protein